MKDLRKVFSGSCGWLLAMLIAKLFGITVHHDFSVIALSIIVAALLLKDEE